MENKTYKKILKIARDLIAEKPYQAVSLNMIAEKAGVTKPSLYYYFQNKEDLFLKLFDQVSQEFEQELNKILDQELSPVQKLRSFIETYVNFFFSEKHLIRILVQRISQQDKNLCSKMKETRENIIKKLEVIMREVLQEQGRDKNITSRMASIMVLGMLGTFYVEHVEEAKEVNISPKQAADKIIYFLNFNNKLK